MKTNIKVVVCLFAAVLVLAGCGEKKTSWQEFTFQDGGFTVSMPGKEVQTKSRYTSTGGGDMEVYEHSVTLKNAYYAVSHKDMEFLEELELTADDIDHILDGSVESVMNPFPDGKIVEKKEVTIDGHPGREFRVKGTRSDTKMVISGKVFLVGNRLYQIQVNTTEEHAENEDITRFLNSFKLL